MSGGCVQDGAAGAGVAIVGVRRVVRAMVRKRESEVGCILVSGGE